MNTVVLVGASSGLGRAVAQQLAGAGHRVVGIGRSPARVAALERELRGGEHVAITQDVATVDGMRSAAEAVAAATDHVDVLINNAGVMLPERVCTTDGYEMNFAVHHLAPFVLTSRLLPLLRRGRVQGTTDLPRVVNVNSAGHHTSMRGHVEPTLDLADLQHERGYDPFLAYSRSKLANLLFSYELARRHRDEFVVNALHPGVVRSDLGREFPRVMVLAAQAFALSPAKAAPAVVRLAVQPLDVSGRYFDRLAETRSSRPSYDLRVAQQLWTVTEQMVGAFDAG